MLASFDEAFAQVKKLVAEFKANEPFYLAAQFSEAQARKDFIDKFFIALGWDVNHDTQKNPYEQEVKIERNESGSQRHADYAFFLSPNFHDVRFFAEAKKPHGDFGTAENYFQTLCYGWNSKTPLAVLTNFDELHILDSRFKPHISDTLSRVVKKFTCSEYADPEKFAEIYWLFSHEAVANHSLAKFAESLPKPKSRLFRRELFKRGQQNPDEAFLIELDAYREMLAKAFKLKNPNLNSEQLTEVTQRTIDRLVFIRFLEDKGIEPHRQIEHFGQNGGSAWEDFVRVSLHLDRLYNGVVFKRHEILDAPGFQVDEKPFRIICEDLSDPNSPYNFATIPIHILGSIYERFLGKIITDGARVVEKPEVRKAGGVYYTPEYIVRYIVARTVGQAIAGKTPAEISPMRFADIACGSGSFLLEVFDCLLRQHAKYYNENSGRVKKGDCVPSDDGLHLSLKKKQEILRNNIYGVDIDRQAVEVAQLSLYLKLLEDETLGSTHAFQNEFHYTLLPPLGENIICGNSLIGPDILDANKFSAEEERKLNPMDFAQRFPKIFRRKAIPSELHDAPTSHDYTMPGVPLHGSYAKVSYGKKKGEKPAVVPEMENEGGFDAIVGNPPYLYSAGQNQKEYFERRFEASEYQTDFYVYFVERAIKHLKDCGVFGMIVSDSWIKGKYFTKLRNFLFYKTALLNVTVFDYPPFEDAAIENSIIFARRDKAEKSFQVFQFDSPTTLKQLNSLAVENCNTSGFIDIHYTGRSATTIAKIEAHATPLSSFCRINRGVHAYRTDGYGKSKFRSGTQIKRDKAEQSYHSIKRCDGTYFPEIKGKHLERYNYHWNGTYISYGGWLAEPRTPEFFFNPKLAIRKIIAPKLVCTLITDDVVLDQSIYVAIKADNVVVDLRFILGIISSSIGGWYIQNKYGIYDTLYPWFTKEQLANFPIASMDFNKASDKARREKIVSLVETMLGAKEQLSAAKTDGEQDFYKNKCATLDRQIDAVVYELYGLTAQEIAIVEGSAPEKGERVAEPANENET